MKRRAAAKVRSGSTGDFANPLGPNPLHPTKRTSARSSRRSATVQKPANEREPQGSWSAWPAAPQESRFRQHSYTDLITLIASQYRKPASVSLNAPKKSGVARFCLWTTAPENCNATRFE